MTIAIASQKGGTGKTTTSITLSTGLGRQGKRILLVDMDSQANSSKVLLPHYSDIKQDETIYRTILERQPIPVHQTNIPNVDIAPSHILLSDTDIALTTAIDHREARLKRFLDDLKPHYDHILIDCPPMLSWLTINAFTASDKVLVTISPGYFELDSIKQINKTIEEVQDNFNLDLELFGYLFTMSDPTNNSKASLEILREIYSDYLFKTVIPRNTDIRDAHLKKTDIFDFSPKAKAAQAYIRFIEELGL